MTDIFVNDKIIEELERRRELYLNMARRVLELFNENEKLKKENERLKKSPKSSAAELRARRRQADKWRKEARELQKLLLKSGKSPRLMTEKVKSTEKLANEIDPPENDIL